jgi:hypothetical protein
MMQNVRINLPNIRKTDQHKIVLVFDYLAGVKVSTISCEEKQAVFEQDTNLIHINKILNVLRSLGLSAFLHSVE